MQEVRRRLLVIRLLFGVVLAAIIVPASVENEFRVYRSSRYRYEVRYPRSWHLNSALASRTGNLLITNFPPTSFLKGGILPEGGAEITVVAGATRDIDQWIDQDLAGADVQSKEQLSLGNRNRLFRSCTQVIFSFEIGPGAYYTRTSCYFSLNRRPFKMVLDYWRDDPNGPTYRAVLVALLRSLTLK